jgi:iron(III) transport system ATP-binding protein
MADVALAQLSKYYGETAAVDDLNLVIDHGAFVCLLGPSGCGKTTTLRLVAGFIEPDRGTIRVGGRVLSEPGRTVPPERRNMSMIFQSYALWPHMTIAENVGYGLRIRKIPRAERERRIAAILDLARLGDLAPRYPHELSGGQQQRAALARALAVEPETLLLDEPLSNLDANLREEMRFEIRRLHDAFKYTTIYVTHDQAEAMTTADTIVVMNRGRVEQVGTPEDIYQRPHSEFVARFIGGSNIFRGTRIGEALYRCGALTLRCGAGATAAPAAAISVRFHEVVVAPAAAGPPPDEPNRALGRVVRHAYLGSCRDYLIELADGQQVRAAAPLSVEIAAGDAASLYLPPDVCRALAG